MVIRRIIVMQMEIFPVNTKWIDVRKQKPEDGQRVIAWQDYRLIGKTYQGAELFYYRSEYGFVVHLDDDDGYGAITHWMPAPFEDGPGVPVEDLDFDYFLRGQHSESSMRNFT